MSVLFEKTSYLTEKPFHYCPGCNHGIIHRLVAECLEESGMVRKLQAWRLSDAPCLPTITLTVICWKLPTGVLPPWQPA